MAEQRYNANGQPDPNGRYVRGRNGALMAAPAAPAAPGPDVGVVSSETGALDVQDNGGNVRLASDEPPDKSLDRLDTIESIFAQLDEDNKRLLEDFLGTSLPELEAAADAANRGDKRALKEFLTATDKLTQIDPHAFDGPIESNAIDVGHQEAARDKFKELSDPSITASERYILESARLDEEQGRRAALEAQLSQLDARGARSGGADIAALLGAQEMTSQNRAIQDLGALAQAQERAQRNLEGYAGQSNTMRSASDEVLQFNARQKQMYDEWADNFRATQQEAQQGRNRDKFDATTGVTDSTYGRGVDNYNAQAGAYGMRSGANREGATNAANVEAQKLALEEERRAEALYGDKERPKSFLSFLDPLWEATEEADFLGISKSPSKAVRDKGWF